MQTYRLLVLISLLLCGRSVWGAELNRDSTRIHRQPHLCRDLAAGNVIFGAGAYLYFAETWGAPSGKFHFKHEFDDNVAFTDEVSHFFAGYKLTEGFDWLFRLLRVQPDRVNRLAAIEAALVTTLIEYPMDAYNPSQGMGISDLAANYAGIGFALLKKKYPNRFDLKFCLKQPPWKFEHKFLASDNAEFDNFIWWGVWKPKYVWAGLGYSTNHLRADVQPEWYLGVGTTLYDLMHLVSPRAADAIKSLDTYFISVRLRL
jgi:hypothetical protein